MILSHQHFELQNRVVLERVVFTPPFKAAAHMQHEACLIYAVNGKSSIIGAQTSSNLNKGESVIMKCGNYINKWEESNAKEPYEAVGIHFYPEVLQYVYSNDLPQFLKQENQKGLKAINTLKADKLISQYIDNLIYYFENPELVNEEIIILKLKEIILLLTKSNSAPNVVAILKDLFNPQELDFKSVIKQNIYNNLSLEDLALLCNMSLSTFKRKFNQIYDASPAKYIKIKRLEKARELIEISTKSISEIAFQSGFNDAAHFSKSFLSHFGVSPSDWKKSKS